MQINIQLITSENLSSLLYKKLIEQNHNIVSQVHLYKDAMINYKTALPDIVLLDLDISTSNEGLTLCRSIYNFDPNAKVIALSEHFDILKKSELFEIGVEYWLEKPLELARVFECIDAISYKNNILELREKRGTIYFDTDPKPISMSYNEDMKNNINSIRSQIKDQREKDEETYSDEFYFDLDFNIDNTSLDDTLDEDSIYGYNSINNSKKLEPTKNDSNKRGYLNLPVFINDDLKDNEPVDYTYKVQENESYDTNNPADTPKKGILHGFINKFKK